MTASYEQLTQSGPGEILLGWLSAARAGTLELLGRRVMWFGSGRAGDLGQPPKNAYLEWVREMHALGYLNVNFSSRRWSSIAPALVALPGLDGLLMLAGVRTANMLEELDRLGFDGFAFKHTPETGLAIPVPGTLLVQIERQSLLEDILRYIRAAEPRIAYYGCAASRLASALIPNMNSLSPVAAPTYEGDNHVEVFIASGLRFDEADFSAPWAPADLTLTSRGAYRWRRPGKLIHAVFDGNGWLSGNRSDVLHAALSMDSQSCLWWTPYPRDPLERGTLSVHRYIDLPLNHKRIATLCTGLPAQESNGVRNYEGVPLTVVESISESLGQQLLLS